MYSRVLTVSRESLLARRESLLDRLDTTADDLRNIREVRSLTDVEWDALEEIDEIDFLLGSDG